MARVLGLDCGIASVGWAVVENNSTIDQTGVWQWQPPEQVESNKRTSHKKTNGMVIRRVRQTKRKRQRLNDLRDLFAAHGLTAKQTKKEFKAQNEINAHDPWQLRLQALKEPLTNEELVSVLYHLATHRAYLSNAKAKKNDPGDDEKRKLLSALKENEEKFSNSIMRGEVKTVGEWLAANDFKRNRAGSFQCSLKREWLQDEACTLLAIQNKKRNAALDEAFKTEYLRIAFAQKPVETQPVKYCSLETEEPRPTRSPRHAYSFEYFRFLQRINDLRFVDEQHDEPYRLTPVQVNDVASRFGTKTQIRYADVRKWLKLDQAVAFKECPDAESEKLDIVAKKGTCCPGYWALKKVITTELSQETWDTISADKQLLDSIAESIAHLDDLKAIEGKLSALSLDRKVVETLLAESNGGELGFYKGTGGISLVAARKLIPRMESGLNFHDAQIAVYGRRQARTSNMPEIAGSGIRAVREWLKTGEIEEKVGSEVASRAIRQVFRQTIAILESCNDPTKPDYKSINTIRIEMARDIGRGAEARDEISLKQAQNRNRNHALEESFKSTFLREPSDPEFERWQLWSEQQGHCAYTFEGINCEAVLTGSLSCEIDHILPRSRFGIDGLVNKVLCKIGANQNKSDQTPFEWFKATKGQEKWEEFCVKSRDIFKSSPKKIELLIATDTSKMEKTLAQRYLNDTRWIGRFVLDGLKKLSTPEWPIQVEPVGAGLVALLRHAWGLDVWKRDPNDKRRRRSDDRHHALDASVVAIIDVPLVKRLTDAYQMAETNGHYFPARRFDPPWKSFRDDVCASVYGRRAVDEGPQNFVPSWNEGLLIARSATRRGRGKLHTDNAKSLAKTEAGLRQVSNTDVYKLVTEKKGVFEKVDLSALKDAERNHRLRQLLDDWCDSWIASGVRPEQPPQWNYAKAGNEPIWRDIKSVPLVTDKAEKLVPKRLKDKNCGSLATFNPEAMIRLDVFQNPEVNALPRFLYIPVYIHQLSNPAPPREAFVAGRPWLELSDNSKFLFSIWPWDLIEVDYNGEIHCGYYRKFDRGDGRISMSLQFQSEADKQKRFSPSLINRLTKWSVDRLGKRHLVESELRTWRGKVCMSPDPQG